ncbi:MAG: alpha/beta fold hydrolase [Oligoflexia bacterium]|nr:alpha/beta fold hydrolase [Oligoflexia bacterium]
MNIPQHLKSEYPFNSNYYTLNCGEKIHYLDEGNGSETIVMVHGNPTWSFYYRNLVKTLKEKYRVIAVDNIGCGLSDKPQDYDYCLDNHIRNLDELLKSLKIERTSLVVHDWGGAIGMGWATRNPEKVKDVVITNTAAFPDENIPARINICKIPVLGEKLVRHFNAFAYPALYMAVEKPMSKTIKSGYILPYNNYKNRIATSRFVQDIPMKKSHKTFPVLSQIEKDLKKITGRKLILWGGKDFCFNDHFFKRWEEIYPEAQTMYYQDAGHYVLEDVAEAKNVINEFFNG